MRLRDERDGNFHRKKFSFLRKTHRRCGCCRQSMSAYLFFFELNAKLLFLPESDVKLILHCWFRSAASCHFQLLYARARWVLHNQIKREWGLLFRLYAHFQWIVFHVFFSAHFNLFHFLLSLSLVLASRHFIVTLTILNKSFFSFLILCLRLVTLHSCAALFVALGPQRLVDNDDAQAEESNRLFKRKKRALNDLLWSINCRKMWDAKWKIARLSRKSRRDIVESVITDHLSMLIDISTVHLDFHVM